MKLFAKKPCSFNGKNFFIGNEIPSEYVLDPKAQEKMGILVVVEEKSSNAASGAGGSLLPPASTLESATDKEKVTSKVTYSKSTLVRMNKEELLKIATEKGVCADDEMKKEEIVDLILKK